MMVRLSPEVLSGGKGLESCPNLNLEQIHLHGSGRLSSMIATTITLMTCNYVLKSTLFMEAVATKFSNIWNITYIFVEKYLKGKIVS